MVSRAVVPLFALTLALGSFLMFAVEPMVGRQLLPVLGGVPMVWNGCVVFFQATLVLGYGCAHVLTRSVVARWRLPLYTAVAFLAWCFVHLDARPAAEAGAVGSPLAFLIAALAASVGLVFLTLAIAASALQSTLAEADHPSARDPYFLYVASNVGSIAGLLAYPSIIEPWLGLAKQAAMWTVGYAAFGLLLALCSVVAWPLVSSARRTPASEPAHDDAAPTTWTDRLRWCLLAAVPSSLLLGVTTTLTTDVAPMPLLWVAPLALYLLTFVVAFSGAGARATSLANRAFPALLLVVATLLFVHAIVPVPVAMLVHLAAFAAAAMLCHGQLVAHRPPARHLTEFYFWLALGGVAGGLFNTLAAPVIFSRLAEYPIALTVAAAVRPSASSRAHGWWRAAWLPVVAVASIVAIVIRPSLMPTPDYTLAVVATLACLALTRHQRPATVTAVAGAVLLGSVWTTNGDESLLHAERTFFGSYRVSEEDNARGYNRLLRHGTTLHGLQAIDADRQFEPLTYYHGTGPFGELMRSVPQLGGPIRVAVIGLGVGTVSAYVRAGQKWTFYEIDPAVERIARDARYFTFLERCGAACRVVVGDARLSLATAREQYGLIVVDAFSSDAIPVHMVTNEAMQVYLGHLAPDGVLAFHITNRHLDLEGVMGRLARANELLALQRIDVPTAGAAWAPGKLPSIWVSMARSRRALGDLLRSPGWRSPAVAPAARLWTDDFSNIVSVLRLSVR